MGEIKKISRSLAKNPLARQAVALNKDLDPKTCLLNDFMEVEKAAKEGTIFKSDHNEVNHRNINKLKLIDEDKQAVISDVIILIPHDF